jgi:hypothetical protein
MGAGEELFICECAWLKGAVEVPGAGVVGIFAEGDGAGGGDEAIVMRETPEDAASDAGVMKAVEFDEVAAALFGNGKRVDDGVIAIGNQIPAEFPDAGEVGVIEDDDSAGLEKAVNVEEVDESGIESVPAVDEGEVYVDAFGDELRESDFGGRVTEVDEVGVSGAFQAVETGAVKGLMVLVDFIRLVLVRIDDDVAGGGLRGEYFADEESRDTIGETDFDAGLRFYLGDEALEEETFFDRDVGVDAELGAGFRSDGLSAQDFVEDGIHGRRESL